MLGLFSDICAIQSNADSATTGQLSVTYTQTEATAICYFKPIRSKELITMFGGIPTSEHCELFMHPIHTIAPGYRVVKDSVTYEVLTSEVYSTHTRCLIRRLEST
jgi:hypothetical protein